MDKPLMAGHIDKSGQGSTGFQRRIEVTQVDGDTAFALLPAFVAGLAGQRLE